jgi:hypothetical protein
MTKDDIHTLASVIADGYVGCEEEKLKRVEETLDAIHDAALVYVAACKIMRRRLINETH